MAHIFTADLGLYLDSDHVIQKKSVVSFTSQAEAEATFYSRQFRFQSLSNLHVTV